MLRELSLASKKIKGYFFAPFIIQDYLLKTPAGQRKLILGGHWSNHPGWLILNEEHQDITKKLNIPNRSFDVIFLEHVLEHIEFEKAIAFLRDAKRILRKGGIIRIVCPLIDRLITTDFKKQDRNNETYIKNSLEKLTYPEINKLLKSLGLVGINADAQTFFLNSLFREQGHQFIWSSYLLKKVMVSLGFKDVIIYEPGEGHQKEYCIERRQRGVYLGNDWQKDKKSAKVFDPESLAVEGVKP